MNFALTTTYNALHTPIYELSLTAYNLSTCTVLYWTVRDYLYSFIFSVNTRYLSASLSMQQRII